MLKPEEIKRLERSLQIIGKLAGIARGRIIREIGKKATKGEFDKTGYDEAVNDFLKTRNVCGEIRGRYTKSKPVGGDKEDIDELTNIKNE